MNWFLHDLLTREKTKESSLRKEVHDSLFSFLLSNSLVAKYKGRTKLAPMSRNLDSYSQFCFAGQGNKHDVCYICLEKYPVGKCSASLQNSAPFTETHCAQSLCFY